jgi:DNA-binding NtrC family response regulator
MFSILQGKPLILCVDDSETQLWLREQVLAENGYSVVSATTAAKALQLLRENPISLVISDHMLSDTTGTQLAGEMKRIRPHIPVVLYSGGPPSTMRNVDCFILKDEPVTHFLAIISDLIERSCD